MYTFKELFGVLDACDNQMNLMLNDVTESGLHDVETEVGCCNVIKIEALTIIANNHKRAWRAWSGPPSENNSTHYHSVAAVLPLKSFTYNVDIYAIHDLVASKFCCQVD